MPTISEFFGISIRMYWREHPPAHFHALYGEHEALISIDSLEPIHGHLPHRALALVVEWAIIHREELRQNWQRAEDRRPLQRIAALDEEA